MGYKEKKLRQFIQYTCTKQQTDTIYVQCGQKKHQNNNYT